MRSAPVFGLVFLLRASSALEPKLTLRGPRDWHTGLSVSQHFLDPGATCSNHNPPDDNLADAIEIKIDNSPQGMIDLDSPGVHHIVYICRGLTSTRTVVVDHTYNAACIELEVVGPPNPALGTYAITAQTHDGAPIYRKLAGQADSETSDADHLFYFWDPRIQKGVWQIAGWTAIENTEWGQDSAIHSGLRIESNVALPELLLGDWTAWNGEEWVKVPTMTVKCSKQHDTFKLDVSMQFDGYSTKTFDAQRQRDFVLSAAKALNVDQSNVRILHVKDIENFDTHHKMSSTVGGSAVSSWENTGTGGRRRRLRHGRRLGDNMYSTPGVTYGFLPPWVNAVGLEVDFQVYSTDANAALKAEQVLTQDKGAVFRAALVADMSKLGVSITKVVVRRVISNVAEQIAAVNAHVARPPPPTGGAGVGDGGGDGGGAGAAGGDGDGFRPQVEASSPPMDAAGAGAGADAGAASGGTAAFGLSSSGLIGVIVCVFAAVGFLSTQKKLLISLLQRVSPGGDEAWTDSERKQYGRVDDGDTSGSGVELAPLARHDVEYYTDSEAEDDHDNLDGDDVDEGAVAASTESVKVKRTRLPPEDGVDKAD